MIMAEFDTLEAALEHRAKVGGWLFVTDIATTTLWFDAGRFTPSTIFLHPSTHGRNGRLI